MSWTDVLDVFAMGVCTTLMVNLAVTRKKIKKRNRAAIKAAEGLRAQADEQARLMQEAVRLAREAAVGHDPVAVTQAVAAIEAYGRACRHPLDEAVHYLQHLFRDMMRSHAQLRLQNVAFTRPHDDSPRALIELLFHNGLHEHIVLPMEQCAHLTTGMVAAIYQEVQANYLMDLPALEVAQRQRDFEVMAAAQRGAFDWARDDVLTVSGIQDVAAVATEAQRRAAAKQKEIRERSIEYFKRWITPEQWAEWEANKHFHVRGGDSGRLYRIRYFEGGFNVEELDDHYHPTARLCFIPVLPSHTGDNDDHTTAYYPPFDIMTIQKLALEFDETESLRVANRTVNGIGPQAGQAPGPAGPVGFQNAVGVGYVTVGNTRGTAWGGVIGDATT